MIIIKENVKSVYLLRNVDTNRIKVGVSKDIKGRLKTLEMQAGCRIELIQLTIPMYNYMNIERSLHKTHQSKRHIGEWFNITKEEAIKSLEKKRFLFDPSDIVKRYEQGQNPTKIAEIKECSRSGIVRYLTSLGVYKQTEKEEPKNIQDIEENINKGIDSDKIKAMVDRFKLKNKT